jgi:putative endonuclease
VTFQKKQYKKGDTLSLPKGWMYILECADSSYYTGSTNNLELRIQQHQNGEGANHTKERLPVKLVYVEEFERIDEAFYREKQVQGWSRKKKEALIKGEHNKLPELSKNYTQYPPSSVASTSKMVASTSSATGTPLPESSTPLPELVEGKSIKLTQ